MTNAEVEELTLDKYFVSNLNLAYTFRPKKILTEVTLGFTVYNSLTRSMKTMVGLQAITPIQWKTGETMPAMPHKPEQTSWDTCLSAFNDISRLWNWTF